MTDHDGFPQIQHFEKLGEIIGVLVHVIAIPRLAGAPMPAAVVADTTISVRGKEEHLIFPRVRAERPSVAESDRLAVLRTPILVINRRAVRGGDRAHGSELRSS